MSEAGTSGLLEPLRVLWRRKWVVVACFVVSVLGMAAIDSVRTPVYEAQGAIQFTDRAASSGHGIQTDAFLLHSSQVIGAASKTLGFSVPALSVSLNTGTAVATVTARASNPAMAARIVNATIQAYITVQNGANQYNLLAYEQTLTQRIDKLTNDINNYTTQLAAAPKGSAQATQLTGLLAQAENRRNVYQSQLFSLQTTSPTTSAVQVGDALPPSKPISPKPTTDILLAGLVGLAIGIAIALLQEAIDDKIRTRADLEKVTSGVPVLGLVPNITEWTDRRVPLLITAEQPKGPAAEAFRSIRTSIQFMAIDDPIKTLLVTSASATDGKTTISSNLAYTMCCWAKPTSTTPSSTFPATHTSECCLLAPSHPTPLSFWLDDERARSCRLSRSDVT